MKKSGGKPKLAGARMTYGNEHVCPGLVTPKYIYSSAVHSGGFKSYGQGRKKAAKGH